MSTSTSQSRTTPRSNSKAMIWMGRILSTLVILFLLFDAIGKFAKPAPVADAFTRLGIPIALSSSIALLLLVCTILYAIPRTAVLGATLLIGYFGGAVAIHMRAGSPVFETIFPVIFGIFTWAGLYVRDCSLRKVFPFRR
jgi:hypothetical protein